MTLDTSPSCFSIFTLSSISEVTEGAGGWGQCIAVSFCCFVLLFFHCPFFLTVSSAPVWGPPWATVPTGGYLLPCKFIHELSSLHGSICSSVGPPQAAIFSQSTCFGMSLSTGHSLFKEAPALVWICHIPQFLQGCNHLHHGVPPTVVALLFPLLFTCSIALAAF